MRNRNSTSSQMTRQIWIAMMTSGLLPSTVLSYICLEIPPTTSTPLPFSWHLHLIRTNLRCAISRCKDLLKRQLTTSGAWLRSKPLHWQSLSKSQAWLS
ncbi:hypothetical protein HDV64DRAFT_131997 [Trichoderma sp. TUCIM 5745]